jgi:transposase
MLADTLGRPLRFRIRAGQAHDVTAAPDLLEGQKAKAVLADKAYDSNDLRKVIAGMKAEAVIRSNDALAVSSISGVSLPATIVEPSASTASSSSRPP